MKAKRRILCVEDNLDSCEMLAELIEGSGKPYSVQSVHNTQEASDLIAHEQFDLYILDIWVPESGGLWLSRRIRERDPITPIIFYSALDSQPSRKKATAAGGNEFLSKPEDLNKLLLTIERLLENWDSTKSPAVS